MLKVSENLNLAAVAPLLCAGITTYSPLRHWKVSKGQKVGVVGLGHMGVKFANAFGAHVVLFTTSPNKTADALRLGAQSRVALRSSNRPRVVNLFEFPLLFLLRKRSALDIINDLSGEC